MENYGKSQHHLPQPARQTAAFWSTPRQSPPGTQGTSWQRGAKHDSNDTRYNTNNDHDSNGHNRPITVTLIGAIIMVIIMRVVTVAILILIAIVTVIMIKGSLGGETSVLRTFRKSEKELVKEP